MNGTYREMERRFKAFEARTGQPYATCWISHERWAMLPQEFREANMHSAFHKKPPPLIAGVPIRLIQLVGPDGRLV